jgi:hypothetical protein
VARAAFILHVFGTVIQAVAAFVVTISAWSNPVSSDDHA